MTTKITLSQRKEKFVRWTVVHDIESLHNSLLTSLDEIRGRMKCKLYTRCWRLKRFQWCEAYWLRYRRDSCVECSASTLLNMNRWCCQQHLFVVFNICIMRIVHEVHKKEYFWQHSLLSNRDSSPVKCQTLTSNRNVSKLFNDDCRLLYSKERRHERQGRRAGAIFGPLLFPFPSSFFPFRPVPFPSPPYFFPFPPFPALPQI